MAQMNQGRRWLRLMAMIAVAWLAGASQAEARRVALIIGNGAYVNAVSLDAPAQDATLVAAAARNAGFEVTLLTNLGRAGFDQVLRDFQTQATGADVAMIYYSGHGLEADGKNWLVPTDAKVAESRDLAYQAIEVDTVLLTTIGAQLKIVVLDACRKNPFVANWAASANPESKSHDDTEMDSEPRSAAAKEVTSGTAFEGVLVIYAAGDGQVSIEGSGGHTPFATSFAARLSEPGLSIHRLGAAVLEDVAAVTGGLQRPHTFMSLVNREFYLVPRPLATDPAWAAASRLPPAPQSTSSPAVPIAAALTGPRLALVIGNSAYTDRSASCAMPLPMPI